MMTATETTPTRDEKIAGVQGLIWKIARSFTRLPDGVTIEDLVSDANIALCGKIDSYDPSRGAVTTWAAMVGRQAMLRTIESACTQKRGGGATPVPLEAQNEEGERVTILADPHASDPAAIAEARELVQVQPGHRKLSVRQLEQTLPSPAAVAEQVTKLRSAMFGAIKEEDIAEVMSSLVDSAKGGDLKAAKLLIDLLAPARSGVSTVVNQQAVVIHPGDVS